MGHLRRWALLASVTLVLGSVVTAQAPTRDEADRMRKKVEAILLRGLSARPTPAPHKTTFTDRELTAYLLLQVPDQLPVGLTQPRILLHDANRIEARAIVDLDAVRKAQPRGWFDPLAYVTGSVQVVTTGTFTTSGGRGQYTFESGTVAGVRMPKSMIQQLVAYYTRTPDTPNGVDLEAPFDLPIRIREVHVQRGAATVVQ